MITKFTLTIDGIEHDLSDGGIAESIKNWADIICAYKRSDYNGIVRSFSSKFQFVNDAYDLLLELFLRDRYDAVAILAVYTINDDHSWMKRFECELDFSTKSIADGVFSIGAIDNSLAALIKANKGTKYEMIVGTDIKPDTTFHFDRIPMIESVSYALSQGESDEDTGALLVSYVPPEDGSRTIWIGKTVEEFSVGKTIYWKDDQENNADGFLIEARRGATVNVSSEINADRRFSIGTPMELTIVHVDYNGVEKGRCRLAEIGGYSTYIVGTFRTENDLNTAYPITNYMTEDSDGTLYAIVGSTRYGVAAYTVYRLTWTGFICAWINQEQSPEEYFRDTHTASTSFDMATGDKLRIIGGNQPTAFMVQSSNIHLSWMACGDACDIPALAPCNLATKLLAKITDGKVNVRVNISDYDDRIANTLILAAESVRAMPNARIYSSFTEFCDWMQTVFGYTYYLGERRKLTITQPTKTAGSIDASFINVRLNSYVGDVDASRIVYSLHLNAFVYRSPDNVYYSSWNGVLDYNTIAGSYKARTDTLFRIDGMYYYIDDEGLKRYDWDIDNTDIEVQDLYFVHRAELFDKYADVKHIEHAREVSNGTISSQIFASVEVGYDKKDYDKINGRDEFNFDSVYTTGCSVSERKLTLKSKYRADCYGIEFAAQKRNAETSDSDSDNDVFFVYGKPVGYGYDADREQYPISGALSDSVFNGAFAPMQCVLANAGYIGMQAESMTLKFASSKGNSDIIVRGMAMSADISLDNPMMMTEAVEFTTDDDELPADINDLIQITDNGITYLGYINEVEMKFARENAIKYKLLIKDMTI